MDAVERLYGETPEFATDPEGLQRWIAVVRHKAFMRGARGDEIDRAEALALADALSTPDSGLADELAVLIKDCEETSLDGPAGAHCRLDNFLYKNREQILTALRQPKADALVDAAEIAEILPRTDEITDADRKLGKEAAFLLQCDGTDGEIAAIDLARDLRIYNNMKAALSPSQGDG